MNAPGSGPRPDDRLRAELGNIDVYLLDQILKGKFAPDSRILDVGCGGGRNIVWLLRNGYDVCGIDSEPQAIDHVRDMARQLAPAAAADSFRAERIESCSFKPGSFDIVLAIAVLHFAGSDAEFDDMFDGIVRMLRPGGLAFLRLTSSIGIEKRIKQLRGNVYRLPDESTRYLVDEAMLLDRTRRVPATLEEPLKTVNVQNMRCMTTWVFRKSFAERAGGAS